MQEEKHPCCLTIAGSDSGGGAGIQADIKTMTVLGCYASSVITALTAQSGLGVAGIHAPAPEFAALQLKTVLEGFPVRAAKTGMLFSADIIHALADILEQVDFPLVVDPVCVSQSGQALLKEDAVQALASRMLPLAALVTPNRPETELLAGMSVRSERDIVEAASRLFRMGAKAVLIKGGHFEADGGGRLTDWLCVPGRPAEHPDGTHDLRPRRRNPHHPGARRAVRRNSCHAGGAGGHLFFQKPGLLHRYPALGVSGCRLSLRCPYGLADKAG